MLTKAAQRIAARTQVRAFSAAPSVDWDLLRRKMMTEEGKIETDKARDAFTRRVSAALAVPEAGEIDWAHYKAKLPEIDVDAIRRDYETMAKATPAITYDAAADKAAHEASEAEWTGFARYCESRIGELEKLQKEQEEYKLHRWFSRARVWQRFPGLYEKLHNQVRGEWDNDLWALYINWKARTRALPWDATHGDLDDAAKKAIVDDVVTRSGLSKSQVEALQK